MVTPMVIELSGAALAVRTSDAAAAALRASRVALVSGSCPSGRDFAPRFFQTPLGRTKTMPWRFANPSPPSGWVRTCTSELLDMLGTLLRDGRLRGLLRMRNFS